MNPWLSALMYGAPSFGMGLLAGLMLRREVTEEVTHMTGPERKRARLRVPEPPMVRRLAVGLAIVVLTVTLASSLLVIVRQNQLQDCLTHVADTTARKLNYAGKVAAEDREAIDDMVKGVLVPGRTATERAQVLYDYLSGREARDAARAKLPPYPVTAGCPN